MPPKVTLNPVLQAYSAFVDKSDRENSGHSTVSRFGISHRDGSPRVIAATKDSCYAANRDYKEQIANNRSRFVFFKAVADQFGGADKIPKKVRDALCAKDFGDVKFKKGEELTQGMFMTGKPLSSYRIKTIIKAITSATLSERELLAENCVQGALALLRAGEVDKDKLGKALTNLVDAALPTGWKTSKNFNTYALEGKFGTQDIRELRNEILSELGQIISKAAGGDGSAPNPQAAEERIHNLLSDLHDVFLSSQKDKGVHVQAFCDKFDTLRKNWDNRLVKLEQSGMRVRSYDDIIAHKFDPNAKYDIAGKTAKEFVKDLLHAMALAEEGKFTLKGGDGDSRNQLIGWVKSRLSEFLSSALKGEARGLMCSHASKWVDENLKLAPGASLGSQVKQVVGKFMNVDWTGADERVNAKLKENNGAALTQTHNWLGEVQELVDAFDKKDFSLSDELARNGMAGRFSRDEIAFIRDTILADAFGRHRNEGVGGAGYMILLGEDSAIFNTHFYERMGRIGVGLTDDEKDLVNEGTRQLRETLLYFADKTGDKMVFSAVEEILKSKGKTKMGLDLISRADVVKAVTYMKPYLFDENGKGVMKDSNYHTGFSATTRITHMLKFARLGSSDTKQIYSLKKESIPANNRATVSVEKNIVNREEEINTRKPAAKSIAPNGNPTAPVNRAEPTVAVPQELLAQKAGLKDRCFKAVFESLLGRNASEVTISRNHSMAYKKFNEEWEKQWKIFVESRPMKSDADLVKWMKEACGDDIVTLDRFFNLFDTAKTTLDRAELLRAVHDKVLVNELNGCYSPDEIQAIKGDIGKILNLFFDAQTKADPLPAQLNALRDASTPEEFREKLIKIACDAVGTRVDASRLWADAEKKKLLTRQVNSVISEKSGVRSMKDILAQAVNERKGLKQHGGNTCFIKSVVNSMIGTEKGRAMLANLIDGNGNYTFTAFNPLTGTKTPVVITDEELNNARTNGEFRLGEVKCSSNAFGAMDDLEIAVWLALGKVHGNSLQAFPGNIGEANLVAYLFGFRPVSENTAGDLGKWADAVSTLGKGGLALYRYATVDRSGKETETSYRHFVSITGVTNENKAKGYELVDSLGNKEAAQLGLEYAEPMNGTFAAYGNQVLCYEYVENPA